MKMVAQLEEKAAEAMKMFERVQAANETAWTDMQTATQKAFAEVQKGWADVAVALSMALNADPIWLIPPLQAVAAAAARR